MKIWSCIALFSGLWVGVCVQPRVGPGVALWRLSQGWSREGSQFGGLSFVIKKATGGRCHVLGSSGCYNKVPQTGGNSRNFSSQFWRLERLRSECRQGQVLVSYFPFLQSLLSCVFTWWRKIEFSALPLLIRTLNPSQGIHHHVPHLNPISS